MVNGTSPVVNTYPLSSYTFGIKEPKMEKDTSVADRLARMKLKFVSFLSFLQSQFLEFYMKEGMRISVEAILLSYCGILIAFLMRIEIEGLKRKLSSKLAANSPALQPNWQNSYFCCFLQIGECVGIWWRPNFETVMYPYCPPHITKPKECKKLFIVHLSEREYFAVPKNLKLLAVPLFELYDNVQTYGPILSSIPQQLSRFRFNMMSKS
ncbi:hypothetical protein Cgig2_010589 [Carnegiea gigantea]|uniref:Pre-mRNA cleavage factor Im 25 kDa subunit n=1 Tax=Carnegiea gigantea TaxID=171969 RepID=A0A9Q1KSN7_9CARY|nr:hypothetical protein Cgig2_010589 [Carnegiea gigantea]